MKKIRSIFFYLVMVTLTFTNATCKKQTTTNTDTTPTTTPALTVSNASTVRSNVSSTLSFYISTDKVSSQPITVDYSVIDGTAIAPRDYTAKSGQIVLQPNQQSTNIEITIAADAVDLRQPNLYFTIQLSNPKNCTLTSTSSKGTIITEDGSYLPTDNTGYTTPLSYTNYNLVWNDEFSTNTLDPNFWNYETGNGTGGWGNNELEYYTSTKKNCFISNGNLIIEARKELIGGFNYSSARITTQNKKFFTFGRIDIRAKLPSDKGIWPALWMLGSNISSVGWPSCGEIDIMELIGTYPNRVYGTMHWKNSSGTNSSKGTNYDLTSGNFSQQFHVFSLVWTLDTLKWYVDDQLFLTTTKADVGTATYPFNTNQFFIFNVAVGGNWPGSPDATSNFPQRMFVDYIRVFQ